MNETETNENTKELSIQEQLTLQQEAITKIYRSVEKTRKMIFWSGIINLAVFVLPLIAVAVLLPTIMNTFTSSIDSFSEGTTTTDTSMENVSQPSLSESLQNLQNLGF